MLENRYGVPQTLYRSLEDFKLLAAIPNTIVAFSQKDEQIEFAFMNRGNDLMKTLHEWGATSPMRLVLLGLRLAEYAGFDDFLILAPGGLKREFRDFFATVSPSVTTHHLGLLWSNPLMLDREDRIDWEGFFVWGFDSI
jgi:hypothetical protein